MTARADRERGFAMILLALSMVALLIIVAIVVDLGNGRQQRRHAQAIADAAALSGAASLTDQTPDAVNQAFYFAFKSLGVVGGAKSSCGTNCQSETATGARFPNAAVQVTTPWQSNSRYVHVQVCWDVSAAVAQVVHTNSVHVCGRATAENLDASSGTGGGGSGPGASSCTSNELTIATNNPIGTSGTLAATYNAAQPLDETSIVFIAPNASGTLVQLNNGVGGYTIVYGAGNTATISYVLPTGLSTATASLFVHDQLQNDCGQVAWSSCPVSTHDDFFETDTTGNGIADQGLAGGDSDADDSYNTTQLANAALIADADDSVSPAPGQQVTPGATLGATFYDEHPIDPSRTYLFLNGAVQNPGYNPAVPNNTVDSTIIGQVSPKVSTITHHAGSTHVTVTLADYLGAEAGSNSGGSPIQGKTVQLTGLSTGTVVPATAVTAADGTAKFTLSNSAATFTVVDVTDGNLVITGGSSAVYWPASSPQDANGNFKDTIGVALTAATTNGWNSAFLYTFDSDRNASGGDCSLVQFAFRFSGGTTSGPNSIALIE